MARIDLNALRSSYMSGEYTRAQLARKFGVSKSVIDQIITYQGWARQRGKVDAARCDTQREIDQCLACKRKRCTNCIEYARKKRSGVGR